MSLAQILANVEQLQREQADIEDSNQRYSEEKLPIEVPSGGGIFTSRFENFAPRFGGITDININPQLTEEESIAEFLQTEGGDVDIEDVARFQPKNIFQKGLGFLDENPAARVGLGALLGGPIGALFGLFSPGIKRGITSLIDRIKPTPSIPRVNLSDFSDTRATTGTGQNVSSGDLSPIGDTGFSEYSGPGVAASYEGSF